MGENKNKKDVPHKVYELWEVMEKLGKYQIMQYVYVCFGTIFVTIMNINYIFLAGDLNYRCRIPECESINATFESPPWESGLSIDRCSKPILNKNFSQAQTCTADSFSSLVEPCMAWVYESNNTIVADLDLACQPLKVSLVGTIHSIGMLVSMLTAGWLADRYGRKPALVFCVVGTCVGHVKTFAKSYYLYVAIDWLEAALSGGAYPAGMVLMLEISGKKHRLLSSVLFAYAIYLGESLFAVLAMFVPYWKTLARIIYTPGILCLSLIWLITESPRWQLLNGKTDKAIETLRFTAKVNNMKINDVITELDGEKLKTKLNIGKSVATESYKKIFSSKHILIRLLVGVVSRFTASFVYYGLMVNSVWLPGNKYTNFLLSTVMSFPGELISLYLMNKIGRKLPLIVGFTICGMLCIGSGYVPATIVWLKITLFLLGKVMIASCYTGSVTYSMELFPTNARGALLGVCAFASILGNMLAPLTPMLYTISGSLPAILFGISAVVTASLITLTPETKELPLFDTVEQVEASMKTKPRQIEKETTISAIA
ncbi:solute carrier family 22 member 3-like [Galleria mellonella]|uniref:Solute carrier family 22 member 3-like n=1 Tax=Galleria mellonella TaxID=7137 RepID=A0ABM3MUN5_GALME|nr:solute carrier family 22 member 3-like [Galleria mellonella]